LSSQTDDMIKPIKEFFQLFIASNTFQKGAALGYFAVFSLIPIIVIIITVLGAVFGDEAVSGEVFHQLKGVLGSEAALEIQDLIKNHHTSHKSIITSIIGIAMLILSASKIVVQLHNAFNDIYSIKAKPKNGLVTFFKRKAIALLLLLVLFTILCASTFINTFLQHIAPEILSNHHLLVLYEHLFSFIVSAVVFSLMFATLGDAKVHWKPAFAGGILTTVLFLVGKIVIGKIIAQMHLETTFGQASILTLIMLWVFYLSQIIFLGACFVKVIGVALHKPIMPSSGAVRVVHKEVSQL